MHAGLLSQDCVKDGLKDIEHEVVEVARIYASDQVCSDVLVHPACAASRGRVTVQKTFCKCTELRLGQTWTLLVLKL
jgi:hypothetical protein